MKLIIAGSRNLLNEGGYWFDELDQFREKLRYNSKKEITEVVCGMAKGADTIGKEWAEKHNIPVKEFPADWEKYGKAAGPIRNKQMADYADTAIVIYNPDVSKGSKNMVEQMKKIGKPVFEVTL